MLKEHAEQKVLSKPQNLHGASAASCYMNIQHIFISHGLPVSTHQADSQHYPGLCLLYIQIIILYYYYIIFIRENHFYLHQFWKNRQTHLNHRDGKKWVTCYYTAVRRFRVYFLFVPWHLSYLPCSSSTYQITYQIQTLPHIIVFTCPD